MRVRTTRTFNSHLTDHDLLRGVDGELTGSTQADVDRHLSECETCRDRRAAIAEMATAASVAYRAAMRSGTHEQSRARLKMGLAQAAQESTQSWRANIGGGVATLRRAFSYAAAVGVVAMAAWLPLSVLTGSSRLVADGSGPGNAVTCVIDYARCDVGCHGRRPLCGHEAHEDDQCRYA